MLKEYKNKPKTVKAIQVTVENSTDVARHCGGIVRQPGNVGVSAAVLRFSGLHGYFEVLSGEWLIQENDGKHYYPCKDSEFHSRYEPL